MQPEYCILSRVYLFNKPFECLIGVSRNTDDPGTYFRFSPSQLLDPLGVDKSFLKLEKVLLARHGFSGHFIKVSALTTSEKLITVPTFSVIDAVAIIRALASTGHPLAMDMVRGRVRLDYGVLIERRCGDIGIAWTKERDVQVRLFLRLGGQREVSTDDGVIDLLTDSEVIEVKDLSAWKCALGQILIYSEYYPSHSKRIHLFSPNPWVRIKPEQTERIRRAYQKWDVRLTADWLA